VHPSAVVELTAVVFPGARVGAGCRVGAGSVVGPGCVLGEGTVLHYGVSVSHARVGARCTLHHGVRLGADGFGFAVDPATGELTKKPQERGVVLGDGVELGANTCVDRGSWRDTRVGDNTKVDNLVQIGHNAVVGAHHQLPLRRERTEQRTSNQQAAAVCSADMLRLAAPQRSATVW